MYILLSFKNNNNYQCMFCLHCIKAYIIDTGDSYHYYHGRYLYYLISKWCIIWLSLFSKKLPYATRVISSISNVTTHVSRVYWMSCASGFNILLMFCQEIAGRSKCAAYEL